MPSILSPSAHRVWLCVSAVTPQPLASPAWEDAAAALAYGARPVHVDAARYLFESPYVRVKREFAAYARPCFVPGRPLLEAVEALMNRIYTEFKFGWTPKDNGYSLFVVGLMAVIVQGGLLRQFQKHIPLHRLVSIGLISSTLCYFAYGAVPQGWMMYIIIVVNVFGYMVQPGLQSLVANAVDPSRQGESMGAVSSLNSIAAMLGPILAAPLLAVASSYPQGDWRIGIPFYLCALIQGVAAIIGFSYFSRTRHAHDAALAGRAQA